MGYELYHKRERQDLYLISSIIGNSLTVSNECYGDGKRSLRRGLCVYKHKVKIDKSVPSKYTYL